MKRFVIALTITLLSLSSVGAGPGVSPVYYRRVAQGAAGQRSTGLSGRQKRGLHDW